MANTVKFKLLAVSLLSIGLLALAFSGVSNAVGGTGGIGGRVANPDPENPRTQSIFIYELDHGDTKKDQLLVMNNSSSKKTIQLGSVDGMISNDGSYTCRQESETVQDSGGWVKLNKKSVTLGPGEEEKVDFTIKVPAKADVGEHNSCLTMWVDEPGEDVGQGVRLHMRQAIRMVITIPGDLHRDISIANFAADASSGKQTYNISVANKGNVSSDVAILVNLTNVFGKEVDKVGGERPVMPDSTLDQILQADYRPMFGGWYKATPSLRYSKELGVLGTQSNTADYETTQGKSVIVFMAPTTVGSIIIAGGILAIAAATVVVVRRRLRNKDLLTNSKRYVVREGDTLQTLAAKHNASWKEIARINKLAAPYSISAGDKLRLPSKRTISADK